MISPKTMVMSGLLAFSSCYHYSRPTVLQEEKEHIAAKIVSAVKSECDRVYLATFPPGAVIVCDEKMGDKYRQQWGLPLEQICEVAILEKHAPPVIEYLWGDDLLVTLKDHSSFAITMSDTIVQQVAGLLETYRKAAGISCQAITKHADAGTTEPNGNQGRNNNQEKILPYSPRELLKQTEAQP